MRQRTWLAMLMGGVCSVVATGAWALSLVVEGGSAAPGDTPDVCVSLADNDGNVSGVQVDLFWDSSCLTVDRTSGDQPACIVNRETRRSLNARVLSSGQVRVLLLSLTDATPMPASVRQLFCCQFRVSRQAAGRTCGINMSNVIASNAAGQRVPISGVPGSIVVRGGAQAGGVGAGGSGPGSAMRPGAAVEGGAPSAASGGSGGAPAAAGGGPAVAPVPAGRVPAPPVGGAMPQMPESGTTAAATEETTSESSPAVTPEATKPTAGTAQATKVASPGTTPEHKGSPTAAATPARSPSPGSGTVTPQKGRATQEHTSHEKR